MGSINVRGARAWLLGLALIAALFTSPFAYALNTHSVDLESTNSQYLSINDASQSGLDIVGDITVEAWIKPESLNAGESHMIVSKFNSADNHSYEFYYTEGQLTFEYDDDGLGSDTYKEPLHLGLIQAGQWVHVAAVADVSASDIKLYINGQELSGSTIGNGTSIFNGAAPFTMGARSSLDTGFADGLVDDVRVWNVARTQAEIQSDMSTELNGDEAGLVGYWKLNNDFADSSGHGNTLAPHNNPVFSTDAAFGAAPPAPTLTFSVSPTTILSGGNAMLSWSSQNTTSCTASGGWTGGKGLSGSEQVSPSQTTTFALDCAGAGGAVHQEATLTVNQPTPPPPPPISTLKVRKTINEQISKSTALQNDDQLKLSLSANESYVIDGVIFASASSSDPDIMLAFFAPSSSDLLLAYLGGGQDGVVTAGIKTERVNLPDKNKPVGIRIQGTIQMGAQAGDLQLKWAQASLKPAGTNVLKGSYLRAEKI